MKISLSDALTLAALALVGLIVYGVANVDTRTLREWAIGLGMDPTHAAASDRGELVRYVGQELLQGLALLAGVAFVARGLLIRAGFAAAAAGPLGWGGSLLLMLVGTKVGGLADDMAGSGWAILRGDGLAGNRPLLVNGEPVGLGLEYPPADPNKHDWEWY